MNYPLISEYIEAIKAAEDNFKELSNLRSVLGDDGQPVMTSGNFAVVFKMQDVETGKFYALKCFTKEQEGRGEAYRLIAEELKEVESPYLTSIRYLDKELFVDTDQTTETEFPVLLMDWVEGKTLDKYLRENLDDKYALEMLAYRFSQLAQWLIPQPFAHGDLKPDNILVREDGTLVLVDYDGMYVPAMKGQKARELGSPDFRHPLRTENDFDEHIDDFPFISILLSLLAISKFPHYFEKYSAADRLLFSERDYPNIDSNPIIHRLFEISDINIHIISSIFVCLCKRYFSFTIPILEQPLKSEKVMNYRIYGINKLSNPCAVAQSSLTIDNLLEGLIDLDVLMNVNGIDYILTGSLGLYIHGMAPISYIPHDIDIIIENKNNHPYSTNQMILDLFVQHCGGERPVYSYYDASDIFVFYIGNHKIEVNAFADRNNIFSSQNYRMVNIMNRKIKINNVLSIFREKYKLRRFKDYKYNHDIQTILNQFFVPNSNRIFANSNNEQFKDFDTLYSEILLKDKIRDFFNGITVSFDVKVISTLFDDEVKKVWLPEKEWNHYYVKTTSWDNNTNSSNALIFGIKGYKYRINKYDSEKVFDDWMHHDVSYLVDLLYDILSEMKIENYFSVNINSLIDIINTRLKASDLSYDKELPF